MPRHAHRRQRNRPFAWETQAPSRRSDECSDRRPPRGRVTVECPPRRQGPPWGPPYVLVHQLLRLAPFLALLRERWRGRGEALVAAVRFGNRTFGLIHVLLE